MTSDRESPAPQARIRVELGQRPPLSVPLRAKQAPKPKPKQQAKPQPKPEAKMMAPVSKALACRKPQWGENVTRTMLMNSLRGLHGKLDFLEQNLRDVFSCFQPEPEIDAPAIELDEAHHEGHETER